jgi:hypothetical protein
MAGAIQSYVEVAANTALIAATEGTHDARHDCYSFIQSIRVGVSAAFGQMCARLQHASANPPRLSSPYLRHPRQSVVSGVLGKLCFQLCLSFGKPRAQLLQIRTGFLDLWK